MDLGTLTTNLNRVMGMGKIDFKAASDLLTSASELLSDPSMFNQVRFMLLRVTPNKDEYEQFSEYKQEYSQFLLNFLQINEDNLYGKLKVAIIKGQVEEVKNLLSDVSIPEIENPDPNDESLAIYAFGRWIKDVRKDILQVLIEKGLDTKDRDDGGWNLLHKFLWFFSGCSDEDSVEITKLLVRSGVSTNDAEKGIGRIPLHMAIQKSMTDVMSYFIHETDVDLCKKDNTDWSALHFAAMNRDFSVVKVLLEKKDQIDMNCRDEDGVTPVDIAKNQNINKEVYKYLLENGAIDTADPSQS